MTENANLKKTFSKLEKRVAKLELENDALEQYGRRNILRVSGIPEEVDEATDDHIIKLANALDVPVTKQDIDRSHRVGKPGFGGGGWVGRADKSKRQHRDIIVKFTSYNTRHRLFQMRKDLRETENDELKVVFINEDLTKTRSKILFEARIPRRENKLKAAYSSDGKILVRDLEDKRHIINSLDDLVKYDYKKPDDGREQVGSVEVEPSTSSVGNK